MNLLEDPWVPVTAGDEPQQITLEELLCSDVSYALSHRRDDMEMAALQLLVCLVQAILTPEDDRNLLLHLEKPLDRDRYRRAAEAKKSWFDLNHETKPFMQDRGAEDKNVTGIQKLLPGLPEGNGTACLFNSKDDIQCLCPSCAAIALFNQATGAPSFGGGFKDPLRKANPITTLVFHTDLRRMIWQNILPSDFIQNRFAPHNDQRRDEPNWVDKITAGEKLSTSRIGLARGLFWQPASLLLSWERERDTCSGCGAETETRVRSFGKRKFGYDLEGPLWPHPHSPRILVKEKWFPVTYSNDIPPWARFSDIMIDSDEKEPALVLQHYRAITPHSPLVLSVGGYSNKQALITRRHHDMITIGAGWPEHIDDIHGRVRLALAYGEMLEKKLYGFGENCSKNGKSFKANARDLFFQRTEALMHQSLQETKWDEEKAFCLDLAEKLEQICRDIFEEVATPYLSQPKGLKAYSITQRTLTKAMKDLRKPLGE